MAAQNRVLYPPEPPLPCESAPLEAATGTGIFVGCEGLARFVARSFKVQPSLSEEIRFALDQLGHSLSDQEQKDGFEPSIPAMEVVANWVAMDSGEATVDLADIPILSSTAASTLAISALSKTVLQFPGVDSVVFTVLGSCEAFWITMGGEGCFQATASKETLEGITLSDVLGPAEAAAAVSFPETIYPNEPNGFTDFYPSSVGVAANTRKVFLSVACHDQNDGVAGGPCIDNNGARTCNGSTGVDYSENGGSSSIAHEAVLGTARGVPGFNNLLERGYTVRIGLGTARNNIRWSNTWTTNWSTAIHIPVHSNAPGGSFTCTSTATNGKGTKALYNTNSTTYGKPSDAGAQVAYLFWNSTVGVASPGSSDGGVVRNDLGELNPTNVEAVAAYLEAEFHTWNTGVNWLRDHRTWAWQIGNAVDGCFGKPRWVTTPYPHVQLQAARLCPWAPTS